MAAAPASQTPSPSGCRNIGYVSASPTPEAPKDEADLDVLQLTPDPTGHLSVLEDHADFGPLANDLGRKVLNFDESPAVLSRGQASPAPAFKSVFDDTDETLMQAILTLRLDNARKCAEEKEGLLSHLTRLHFCVRC